MAHDIVIEHSHRGARLNKMTCSCGYTETASDKDVLWLDTYARRHKERIEHAKKEEEG